MATYSVADLIGKSIIAKGNINIYRLASDGAPVEYVVKPGQTVGVVDSWLSPKAGRSYLHLVFYDAFKRPYYIRWGSAINTGALIDQGVKSDETKAAEAAEANKPFSLADFIQKNITMIVVAAGIVVLGKTAIQSYTNRKQ